MLRSRPTRFTRCWAAVKALAAKAGISPDVAGSAIAQLLPGIVDKLTPNGQVPAHNSVMDMVGGLLQNLGKAS